MLGWNFTICKKSLKIFRRCLSPALRHWKPVVLHLGIANHKSEQCFSATAHCIHSYNATVSEHWEWVLPVFWLTIMCLLLSEMMCLLLHIEESMYSLLLIPSLPYENLYWDINASLVPMKFYDYIPSSFFIGGMISLF